ncbi:PREDICTED: PLASMODESMATA CALLOSE-BINDING PROTEIN 3-like isoform X1 [Ipomoea nil]|uniref:PLASMODESMATA CALLOSE-BINDING PROTEIN 3-like isoform X1 n=1 Tax=Ipomoea nil TaxID=35883 RepID=UPI0009015B95|nr:PREDICTED: PLASMODESMATA CALLOSE-BINDING PROTEIN 3-like isoform X1 [Ipomoea nil]
MASLVSALLFLAMAGHSSATWCICKGGMSDSELQTTLDYACGNGADCNPIHQNGPCYNPNTVRAHCNYAVNSFFQKKGQAAGTCDFSSTASITTTDPSINGCAYPSSASGSGSTSPTTPSTGTPSTSTGSGSSPNPIITTTPTTTTTGGSGALGGGFNNGGLGPSGSGGVGTYNDMSHAGISMLIRNNAIFPSITLLISALAPLLWLQQGQ